MNETVNQAAEEDDTSAFLRRFLHLVAKGKWLILGTTLIVTVAAVFWTLRQPPIFQAECVIEYDTQPPRPLGTGVEEVHGESHYWLSREFFDTQNEVIASRRVAELTVLSLSLHLDPSFMGVPEESLGDWTGGEVSDAAIILQGMLTVVPDDATRLVKLRVRAGSAERAAGLANGIADAYVARSVESRSASTVAALGWLGTQLDDLGVQLSEAEVALHDFRNENSVLAVSLEDRQNLIAAELEAFHSALTTARAERIELAAAHRLLREAGGRDPMDMPGRIFEESPTIERLRQQIQERTAELATLSGRYGAAHPQITALTLEVNELRGQLRGEVDNFVAASGIRLRATDERIMGLTAVVEEANEQGLALNLKGIDFRRLHRDQESKERLYNLVLQRVSETNVTSSLESTHASILDRALVPTAKVSPSMSKNAMLGVFAGLLLGFMFAFLRETLTRSVATVEDVEALGLLVLGIFPRTETTPRVRRRGFRVTDGGTPMAPVEGANLISHTHPTSIAAECCKTIRTNLMFRAGASSLTTLLVTSPNSGDGKTTVATNLAVTLAQSGKRVLLIDSDLRRPRMHSLFEVEAMPGWTAVLTDEATLEEVAVETHVPRLSLIPAGSIVPNPSELLHADALRQALGEARERYDVVIIDSPPLGPVADAAVLATEVGRVLLVAKSESTSSDALTSAMHQIAHVGAEIVGCVLNAVDLTAGPYRYYRYQRYADAGYYGRGTPEAAPSTVRVSVHDSDRSDAG